MEQTAVEYLVDQLLPKALTAEQYYHIEQAKEIEKQQLYNFYMQGGVDAITEADRNVEQYYNETFKSE